LKDNQNERHGVDLLALTAWMDAQGLGVDPITDAELLEGGTQNILLRFKRGEQQFVLRRPPPVLRANSNETMGREARVLSALAGSSVPHPRLIASCDDEAILGATFYLMEAVNGYNPSQGLPKPFSESSEARFQMGLSLVDGIAALGRVDYQAVGLTDFGKPENFLERQVGRWRAQLEGYADITEWDGLDSLPDVNQIADWLERHRPASFQPGIIHGDYHLANVMYCFDAPKLAAIIDWELTTIGDPLIDLGWLLATWPDADQDDNAGALLVEPWSGFPTTEQLVAHYAQQSERDLSAIHWYAVLACYKLGIILEGTYARACAGKAPKDIGDDLHRRTLWLLNRALSWVE